MMRTIVVSISNFVCRILEPFRTDYAGGGCVCCEDAWHDLLKYEADVEAGLYGFELDENGDPLDDRAGVCPGKLDNGKCGCDRPRWSVRPCGHYGCESECGDCPANRLWRDEQESWCGCARPGSEGVLACGHCSCGYGCQEVGRSGCDAAMRKAPCAA